MTSAEIEEAIADTEDNWPCRSTIDVLRWALRALPEVDRWRSEALAARELLQICGTAYCEDEFDTRTIHKNYKSAYAAARAANGEE